MGSTPGNTRSSKSSPALSSPEQRIDLLWPQVHTLNLLAQLGSFTAVARRWPSARPPSAAPQRARTRHRPDPGPSHDAVLAADRSRRKAGGRTADGFAQISSGIAEARDLATSPRGLIRVSAPVALGRQRTRRPSKPSASNMPTYGSNLNCPTDWQAWPTQGFDLAIKDMPVPRRKPGGLATCQLCSLLVGSASYQRRTACPSVGGVAHNTLA